MGWRRPGPVPGALESRGFTQLKQVGKGAFGRAIVVQDGNGERLVAKEVDLGQGTPLFWCLCRGTDPLRAGWGGAGALGLGRCPAGTDGWRAGR